MLMYMPVLMSAPIRSVKSAHRRQMFDNLLFMTGKACSTSAAQGLAARRLFAAGGWPAHEQPAAGPARPTMLFRSAVSGIIPR